MLGKQKCFCLSKSGGCSSAQGSTAGQGIGAYTVHSHTPLHCPGTSCGDQGPVLARGIQELYTSQSQILAAECELCVLNCKEWDVLITGDIHWRETWSQG